MKTLADRGVLDATVFRLSAVTSDRLPIWGAMSAHQMVYHLDHALRMSTGELPVRPCPVPFTALARFVVFRSGIPWPRNIQTVPELDLRLRPDAFPNFDTGRERLIERMRAFPKFAPDTLLPAHPMLGSMSHWEWMRWGYLHADHHLRQFSC